MEDLLIEILEKAFKYPVIQQGSLSPDEKYPDHFFTFWNNAADGTSHYDNQEGAIVWNYDLNFYSIDPVAVSEAFKMIKGKQTAKRVLKEAGFIISGGGYSVMSDEPTHTGRGITVLYREKQ